MPDRVDRELTRIATALAEMSPPKPELPRQQARGRKVSHLVVAATAFVGVLGLGVAAGLLFDPTEPTGSGIVPIPEGHVASQLIAEEASPSEVQDLSAEMGYYFACGTGAQLDSCVVWEDGVAVIIPFQVPEGTTAGVSTPSHESVLEVPFEVGEPVAVVHESGDFTLIQHVPGVDAPFSYGTEFPPASGS